MEGKLVSKPITGTRANAFWSHDGAKILAGLENGSCVILDKTGRAVSSLRSSGWPAWVGDEAVVIGQIGDKHVFLDLVNGSLLGELDAPSNVLGSAFSHWSNLVAITYGGVGYVYVSSLSNWSTVSKIPVNSPALSMAWSNDDAVLAYAPSGQGTLCLWDASARKTVQVKTAPRSLAGMAWSPDDSLLAVSSWDWVRIYNGSTLELVLSLGPTDFDTVSVSWTVDGSRIVTGSMGGSVRVWDISPTPTILAKDIGMSGLTRLRCSSTGLVSIGLESGEVVGLSGPDLDRVVFTAGMPGGSAVSALDWKDDSALLAAGSTAGMIAILTGEGSTLKSWTGHAGRVNDLEWRPDGEILATLGIDGQMCFWDSAGSLVGRVASESQLSKGPSSLAWSGNGTMIAVGYGEGNVRVWSYPALELQSVPARRGLFTSLFWNPTAENGLDLLVGAGSSDGVIDAWEVWGRAGYYEKLSGHRSMVTDLSWSPVGSVLASCSIDGDVRLWSMLVSDLVGVKSAAGLVEILRAGSEVVSVDICPDGRIYAACRGGEIYGWLPGDRLVWSMANHTTRIEDLSWSPDSTRIVYNLAYQELAIYDLGSDQVTKCTLERSNAFGDKTMALAWSSDGTRIAAGGGLGYIQVLDPVGRPLFDCAHSGGVFCLAWSPDSDLLAAAGESREVRIWDGHTGSLVAVLPGHTGIVVALSWSSDGKWLVSGSYDGCVKVWDMTSGTLSNSFKLGDSVLAASINPDTGLVAAVVYGAEVGIRCLVIDVKGSVIWTQDVAAASGNIAWSPDGRYLVVPTLQGKIVYSRWGYGLCNLSQPTWVDRVQCSPDGRYIASGGYDGVLRIYDAEPIAHIPESLAACLVVVLLADLVFGSGWAGRRNRVSGRDRSNAGALEGQVGWDSIRSGSP